MYFFFGKHIKQIYAKQLFSPCSTDLNFFSFLQGDNHQVGLLSETAARGQHCAQTNVYV